MPVRARADGWTPKRQTGFIEALARLDNAATDQENGVAPARRPPLPEMRLLTRMEEEALVFGRGEQAAEALDHAEERRLHEEVERLEAEERDRVGAAERRARGDGA